MTVRDALIEALAGVIVPCDATSISPSMPVAYLFVTSTSAKEYGYETTLQLAVGATTQEKLEILYDDIYAAIGTKVTASDGTVLPLVTWDHGQSTVLLDATWGRRSTLKAIETVLDPGHNIVFPFLRPLEIEVEEALHCVGGLTIWRIDTTGTTITSPCVFYEVTEERPTSWYCDYTVILQLIVDGEPSASLTVPLVASMLRLSHARQLSYDLHKDKETGYHIARMVFKVQRAIGE